MSPGLDQLRFCLSIAELVAGVSPSSNAAGQCPPHYLILGRPFDCAAGDVARGRGPREATCRLVVGPASLPGHFIDLLEASAGRAYAAQLAAAITCCGPQVGQLCPGQCHAARHECLSIFLCSFAIPVTQASSAPVMGVAVGAGEADARPLPPGDAACSPAQPQASRASTAATAMRRLARPLGRMQRAQIRLVSRNTAKITPARTDIPVPRFYTAQPHRTPRAGRADMANGLAAANEAT